MPFISLLKKENERYCIRSTQNAGSFLLSPLMLLAFLVKLLHVTDIADRTPTAPETKSDISKSF